MTPDVAAECTRVVLDTNVLVAAAFRPGGAADTIVRRACAGELLVIWNLATRRESERIVRRIPPIARTTVLDVFTPAGEFAGAASGASFGIVADPGDRKFAALACAARATLITQDRHLLSVRALLGCPVLTPRALVALRDGA